MGLNLILMSKAGDLVNSEHIRKMYQSCLENLRVFSTSQNYYVLYAYLYSLILQRQKNNPRFSIFSILLRDVRNRKLRTSCHEMVCPLSALPMSLGSLSQKKKKKRCCGWSTAVDKGAQFIWVSPPNRKVH